MSGDPTLNVDAVFISMRDADELRASPSLATPYPNALPGALWDDNQEGFLSWSGVLIWLLGVCTCAYASHKSCDDVRKKRRLPTTQQQTIDETDDEDEPSFDLTPLHAVGFIVIASMALVILFFFDLHMIVVFMYAVSAASTSAAVVWRPLLKKCLSSRYTVDLPRIGEVALLDLVSGICGVIVAVWWLCVQNASYAWLFQDLFGICLCVLFLSVIKLSSLRVASLLLCMAFCYDIFFVFISPHLFGESVMVRVATGKAPRKMPIIARSILMIKIASPSRCPCYCCCLASTG
jgi:signal peptide peptidase-like protein 2B